MYLAKHALERLPFSLLQRHVDLPLAMIGLHLADENANRFSSILTKSGLTAAVHNRSHTRQCSVHSKHIPAPGGKWYSVVLTCQSFISDLYAKISQCVVWQ